MTTSSATTIETVAAVRKYIEQLKKEAKIGHALRRLDRLALTEPIMAETAVGRAVNAFCDHPEYGRQARELIEKWITIAAEAKGIVMIEPKPSRKRPANDTAADEFTSASGMSFADALKACDAPPPAKKMKLIGRLAPAAPAENPMPKETAAPTNSTTPENTDGLFVIERTHTHSKVYSGKPKTSGANANNLPTIAALLQRPANGTYEEAEPVLQRCTVEQLQRVELLNPQWQQQNERIWKKLCLREFPDATARDTFSWRLSYQQRIQAREDRLAAIKTRLCNNNAAQSKHAVPLMPVIQKKAKQSASSSHRAPLAPINGNRPSANQSTPSSRTTAPAKRPAPLMAKAIKMMNNRHRR